jgi:hypothetical protein
VMSRSAVRIPRRLSFVVAWMLLAGANFRLV